jgi:regulation of enolase protein 1 (concanavalin A-like superfamily)
MTIQMPALPGSLTWDIAPLASSLDGSTLTISAGPVSDLFSNPNGDTPVNNSPRLLFSPGDGDYLFSAHVSVDFAAMFDAGVLIVYASASHWAKLCFEFSPRGEPMVVSVVNRGVSDDCNSVVISGNAVYLRVARIGATYAFHYSLDGVAWNMVRYFALGVDDAAVGFSVQSPTGAGCTATFDDIRFETRRLADLRSGE